MRPHFAIGGKRTFTQSMANGRARLARLHLLHPAFMRHDIIVANNFYLVAIFKRATQRHGATINPRTTSAIANLSMHGISKIMRRCPMRQGNQPPFWAEAKNLVVKKFQLGVFQKLFCRAIGANLLHHIAQPLEGRDFAHIGAAYISCSCPCACLRRILK